MDGFPYHIAYITFLSLEHRITKYDVIVETNIRIPRYKFCYVECGQGFYASCSDVQLRERRL